VSRRVFKVQEFGMEIFLVFPHFTHLLCKNSQFASLILLKLRDMLEFPLII